MKFYLTIRLRASDFYAVIVDEDEARNWVELKSIFKHFFSSIFKSSDRWLLRYSLSIEEYIASRVANQI